MPSGSCLCGNVKLSYEGEPAMKALCHCVDCHKISGSTYSTNVVVKEDQFKWEGGKPKTFAKTADSGKNIVSHFCDNCGSTVARTGETFAGMVIIKAGCLDGNGLEAAKPNAELYSNERMSWVAQAPETKEMTGMGS